LGFVGALGRIRTCDTRFRRAVLYPLSYEGVRTNVSWSEACFRSRCRKFNRRFVPVRQRGGNAERLLKSRHYPSICVVEEVSIRT
jgi:hypothetical protein